MNVVPDYYALLGVAPTATALEIKTAFKKMALRYHPDVYKGDDAHERMRQLLQAYQTLNDPVARKQYDSERTGSARGDRGATEAGVGRTGAATSSRPPTAARRPRQEARRDRQRYYDFPEFLPGQPVRIDLIDIAYTLSQQESRELVRHGLLRGIAPETEAQKYFCHRCHHRWPINGKGGLPSHCPNCQASDWPEYLLLRCMHCNAVFESEQIRYTVGSLSYGRGRSAQDLCPPYELFPLCPYCGMAHWSQAEEARVDELRQQAARHAALVRTALFCLLIATMVVLGAIVWSAGR